jgi:membrane-associated phospholipid phosphatase
VDSMAAVGIRSMVIAVAVVITVAPARAQDLRPAADLDAGIRAAVREALAQSAAAPDFAGDAVAAPQDAAPPPTPTHTGLSALAVQTWGDFKSFPQRPSTWVILGVAGAGALAVHPLDDNVVNHFENSTGGSAFWAPGKYIGGIGMAVAPVTIYVLGRYVFAPAADQPQTNKWSHLGFDLVRAQIVNEVIVQAVKFSVQRTRPNGDNYSFPSGHSAATFAFASVLERHFGYRFAWPTVAIASYVAASRLHDNVHYLSDVVFGAGLGTAVGWTVVGRHGRDSYAIVPSIGPHAVTFTLTRTPSRAAPSE